MPIERSRTDPPKPRCELADVPPLLEVRVPSRPELAAVRTTESILLGRSASCTLSFGDHRVSRRHAEVYRIGDVWWIRDLDSLAGTYVDGQPIDCEPVVSRMVVRLGEAGPVVVLELDEPRRQ